MVFAGLIALLAAADLTVKWLIEHQETDDFPRELPGSKGRIWLHRDHNAGFPFGFLEKYGELVRTVPLVVTSALAGVFCYLVQKKGHTAQKLGLAMIIGGSLSNVADRYIRRYVVDYFSFRFGFLKKIVFNLGDMFVLAGSALLMAAELAKELRALIPRRRAA